MKKNVGMAWLLTACLTLSATSLTSCLGSGDDNQTKITKEEVQLAEVSLICQRHHHTMDCRADKQRLVKH